MNEFERLITSLYERNENFVGTIADFTKMQRYQALRDQVRKVRELCRDARLVVELEPNSYEMNALICMDIPCVFTMDEKQSRAFAKLLTLSDRFTISALPGKQIRVSFGIERIFLP